MHVTQPQQGETTDYADFAKKHPQISQIGDTLQFLACSASQNERLHSQFAIRNSFPRSSVACFPKAEPLPLRDLWFIRLLAPRSAAARLRPAPRPTV